MRIAIANVMAPYVYGGAEFLADSLRNKLIEYGHEAQVIRFHYSWVPKDRIVDGIISARLTKIEHADRVIGLKFPAYLIPHSDKKLWLVHQFRQAYDLEGTEYDMFDDSEKDQKIKTIIRNADNKYLKELEGNIYTNSHVVSDRLKKYNGISSQVLYPPLMDAESFSFGEYGDYIFYPGRVNHSKRQHLAVMAMHFVQSDVKLVIAGKGDSKSDEDYIQEQIEKYGLKNKVTYINRFITQEEKAELFKNSLAGIYIPFDEDSYGYVTLEAIQSGKAVISCTDAGGTAIVVKNEKNGYMTDPTPEALAEAMDKLYINKRHAKEMGLNGLSIIKELGISWDNVIRRFTE